MRIRACLKYEKEGMTSLKSVWAAKKTTSARIKRKITFWVIVQLNSNVGLERMLIQMDLQSADNAVINHFALVR